MATPPKGHADYLALGDWNAACVVCGRKYKASEMVKLPAGVGPPWGGGEQYVCRRDYRPRQPQDFVRGIPEKMSPPWVQPWEDLFKAADYFPTEDDPTVAVDTCTFAGAQVTVSVFEGQALPTLTIMLGTGANIAFVLNVYGSIGAVNIHNSSDPCLPAAVTITGGIGTGGTATDSLFSAEFSVQPSNTSTVTPITPAIEVTIVDLHGNPVTGFTGTVSIALGANPGGATLSGTTSVTAVAGVATFDDLVVDEVGIGYTLVATATQLAATGTSDLFDIALPVFTTADIYNDGTSLFLYATSLDARGFTSGGISFYNGVLWLNWGTGGNLDDHLYVFNLLSQSTPINTVAFGADLQLKNAVHEEDAPPGQGFLAGPNNSTVYAIDFDASSPVAFTGGVSDPRSLQGCEFEETAQAVFCANYSSGGSTPMTVLSDFNAVAHTYATTLNFGTLSPTYRVQSISYNGGVIDSRVYCVLNESGTFHLAWVDSDNGTPTILATFANSVVCSMLAGQFGGGSDTVLFNMSGNAAEANVLQKRDLDGALLGTVVLPGYSDTAFDKLAVMTYDPNNNHVWVQSILTPYTITCVDAESMEVLAQGALSPVAQNCLLQPIGHPAGGAVTVVQGKLVRVYLS